ncbi:MAG: ArnT family glycosyltransferase [Pyrinomonadaceae bacterium]
MLSKDHFFQFSPIALAIILGLAAIAILGPHNPDFVDSADYLAAARMILTDGAYPAVGGLPFFRAPLYPGFIAAIWSVFPESILAIKIAQVGLHGITCWLIFRIVMLITENKQLSLVGAILFAINPFFLHESAAIQTENLQIFLITLSLFIVIRMILANKIELKSAALLGIVCGLAALNKPSALAVGAFFAVAFFLFKYRLKGSLLAAAAVVLFMFIAVLPWSLYNAKTRGEFILINDGGGFALWFGNLPDTLRLYEGSFASRAEAVDYQEYLGKTLSREQINEWESTSGYESLSFKQREALWQNAAIENMTANPGLTARLFAWKFYNYWKPYVSSDIYSMKAVALSAVTSVPLYFFGFLGILKTAKDKRVGKIAWLFGLMAVFVTLIHVVVVSSMRLRLPYVDPFLTAFAGIGLGSLLLRYVEKFEFSGFIGNLRQVGPG